MEEWHTITSVVDTTLPIAMTISAFTAIAWYVALELNFKIWMTFKRYSGLYFYMLLVSSWGAVTHALSFLMKIFNVWTDVYVSITIATIGWYAMVTGQSLVLYSRLHLIERDRRRIRWVLYMILGDVIVFHNPTTVLTYAVRLFRTLTIWCSLTRCTGQLFPTHLPGTIFYYGKIQITAFCIQELIISGLYVYETRRILQPRATFQKKRTHQVMLNLLYVNLLIIVMDITLLCTEYVNLYDVQIAFKSAIYAVKLRLEFAVLNSLMSVICPRSSDDPQPAHRRSSTRGVGLETFYHQDRDYEHTQTEPGYVRRVEGNGSSSYTVFAGRSTDAPKIESIPNKGVMMTTEITINTEENSHRQASSDTIASPGKTHRQEPSSSPSSSEIEFVRAGY